MWFMGKKLSEMSLEELWQLFPIILTRHQDCWKKWYLEEEALLKKNLLQVERISHIVGIAVLPICIARVQTSSAPEPCHQ